ncbi:DUF1735 domain-containing protein [Arcticibacter tournemirensis]|uniref:DUF1735 domain-containing protein n=1 Tax=Arcticibacter tournemirensis TaxID=699437 RepID=A0A5M9HCJ9_9SPHI|nr:DUF1735 domain-containing protein [Arcticibacter tournemirensis]KAA8484055.1 DUF1735 domain-containing protein [Arcticibacter tournemirensis]
MMIKKIPHTVLILSLVGCSLLNNACKDTVDLPDQPIDSYNKVYMPQSVAGTVSRTLNISDTLQVVTYGAAFGGFGYPNTDIPVVFTVNNQLVAEYNTKNNTNYPVLPESMYTLSSTSTVIPKGKLSTTPLSILLKTKGPGSMIPLKSYLLPITMSAQGVAVNPELTTAYFLVKAQPKLSDYPLFDRSQWQIIDISSEEATGEGPNNGRAIFALDNNKSTFWHSRWSNGGAVAPHHITIDMGTIREIHGFYLVARQADGNGKPQEVSVQTSLDNVNWTSAGTINFENKQQEQFQFLTEGFPTARYFKFTIVSAYGASYMQIAELNAF